MPSEPRQRSALTSPHPNPVYPARTGLDRRDHYIDRYLPRVPLRIEDRKGKLLSTIQYIHWQDGGVILLKGKLPLMFIMIYLGKEALQKADVISLPGDLQISHVLPITPTKFNEMLTLFHRQSNMVVRREEGKWIIKKLADEGTASPFYGRLYLGLMRIRDLVYHDPQAREKFDNRLEQATSSLVSTRTTMQAIVSMWQVHSMKVASGEVAHIQGQAIKITENIDRELRRESENFINVSARTLKQGIQEIARQSRLEIGFLFKKESLFLNGIASLRKSDPLLAEYLEHCRVWSERLNNVRNDMEHNGWILPSVAYDRSGSEIVATQPLIAGQPLTEFVSLIFDRLCCSLEELVAHGLQKQIMPQFVLTEVIRSARTPEMPDRFRPTLAAGGFPRWEIKYHASSFEET